MKIKEFSKRTGLSESKIRYYDDINLLNGKRNENNYRDFDESDAIDIYRLQMFKSYDISIDEARKRQNLEKNELIGWINSNIDKLSMEIEDAKKKLNRYKTMKSYAEDTVSENRVKIFDNFFGQYVVYAFGRNVKLSDADYKDISVLSSHMPYTYIAIRISKESIMNGHPETDIGFGILDINKDLLDLDLSQDVHVIPSRSIVQFMFEKENVTSFTLDELGPMIDYMKEHHGLEDITGRIYFSYKKDNVTVYSVGLAIEK